MDGRRRQQTRSGHSLVVIKPSGVKYLDLKPEQRVEIDLNGEIVEGGWAPSSHTASHLHICRHRPNAGGIVRTHLPGATAFAVAGKPIPLYPHGDGGRVWRADSGVFAPIGVNWVLTMEFFHDSMLSLSWYGYHTVPLKKFPP